MRGSRGGGFHFALAAGKILISSRIVRFYGGRVKGIILSLSKEGRARSHLHAAYGNGNSCSLVISGFGGFTGTHGRTSCCVHNACARCGASFSGSVVRVTSLKFGRLSVRPIISSPARPCTLGRGSLPVLGRRCRVLTSRVLEECEGNGNFAFCRCVVSLGSNPYVIGQVSNYKINARCVTIAPDNRLCPYRRFINSRGFLLNSV